MTILGGDWRRRPGGPAAASVQRTPAPAPSPDSPLFVAPPPPAWQRHLTEAVSAYGDQFADRVDELHARAMRTLRVIELCAVVFALCALSTAAFVFVLAD